MIGIHPATRSFVPRPLPIRLPVRVRGEIGQIRAPSDTFRVRLWSRQPAVRAHLIQYRRRTALTLLAAIDQAEVKNPNRRTADFVQPEF